LKSPASAAASPYGLAAAIFAIVLAGIALAGPSVANAAGPPSIGATWVTDVTQTSAVLRAEVNPDGVSTRYRFEYLTLAAFEANLDAGHEGFEGAKPVPSAAGVAIGSGSEPVKVSFTLNGPGNPLAPGTAYRYRVVALYEGGSVSSDAHGLRTESSAPPQGLPDGRAWEMVSPVDKGGGAITGPGQLFGGGEIQAASGGGALTYGSATAFAGPLAAPPVSQYLSVRGAGGWSTANISVPLESGGYGDEPDGAPFRFFSEDLARGLLLNPRRCEPAEPCPRSYSLWEGATDTLTPLPAQASGMRVLSASSDLGRVVFEGEGETYEWSGGGLVPISLLPPSAGPGAAFEASSADGRFVFYTEGGRLYRYDTASEVATDLTPSGGVVGVLGASGAGDAVYYQDGSGLRRWDAGTTTTVAAGADATLPSDYPPATATARLSSDGTVLAFLSAAPIGGYDNTDAETGLPDVEAYLYDAGSDSLLCASCNPSGERPAGSASIPGDLVNGSTALYRPRALSANGRRLFFTTTDELVGGDTNSSADVYQWEALGEGGCAEAPGCVALISGGRGEGGRFLDASADGDDIFFLTGDSLVGSDPGSIDAYDARVGGGLPEPQPPIPCNGDACQPLPPPPADPTAGTSTEGTGNPPPRYAKEAKRRHPRKHRHHHRHPKRHHKAHR
jgi:hypothetical protein